jgi:hypothetical protein
MHAYHLLFFFLVGCGEKSGWGRKKIRDEKHKIFQGTLSELGDVLNA